MPYPTQSDINHLLAIARFARLEVVQVRPEVELDDAEVWVSLPSGKLGGLLARTASIGHGHYVAVYGYVGEADEQAELHGVLTSCRNHLGNNLAHALSLGVSFSDLWADGDAFMDGAGDCEGVSL